MSPRINLAILFLTIIYGVGLIGFSTSFYPDFPKLTPLNLLLSLSLCLAFHPNWSGKFVFWCLTTAFFGYAIEVLGVATGLIFGHYQYGQTLGFKFLETPLSMSINWLLTAYTSAVFIGMVTKKTNSWFSKALLAALLMVSLDVLIEPIAMRTGMWSWTDDWVPLQNYIGWFLAALPLQCLFFGLIGSVQNKVAVAVLYLQFAFFWLLNYFF
jgi:putative membrane protein